MTGGIYVRYFPHLVIFLEQSHILKSTSGNSEVSVSGICFSLGFWSFGHYDILGNLCINYRAKLRFWVVFSSSWEDLLLLLAGS